LNMSKILLGYWDLRGLGEPIRVMLEHLGVEYDEKKFGHYKSGDGWDRSEWRSVKFTLGFDYPNLPYLTDGDVKVSESWAIMKYLARKFKVLGAANEEEQIKCDVAEGVVQDFRSNFTSMCYNPEFDSLKANYLSELPAKLTLFEKNLAHGGWLIGSKLTYVDFALCEILDHIRLCFPGCLDKHEVVLKYLTNFESLEKIAAYRKSGRFQEFPINGKMAMWGGESRK
uniref:glutathione transferase n=1 Tax=Ciona savignyi TaxID=51511 RepID=H2ZPT7_CIOSA